MELFVNMREMLRYWGIKGEPSESELKVAKHAADLAYAAAEPKYVLQIYDCSVSGSDIDIGGLKIVSRDLSKTLGGCHSAAMVCATVGIGIDNLIRRYNGADMALASAVSAAGSALAETLIDTVQNNLRAAEAEKGNKITPRYSPGFGDVGLDIQKDFFERLDITRRIGVVLGDSYLMTPTKSVTAFIGIKKG